MNHQNQNQTNTIAQPDTLTRDFLAASMIVSVLVNLTVFVSWLAVSLA